MKWIPQPLLSLFLSKCAGRKPRSDRIRCNMYYVMNGRPRLMGLLGEISLVSLPRIENLIDAGHVCKGIKYFNNGCKRLRRGYQTKRNIPKKNFGQNLVYGCRTWIYGYYFVLKVYQWYFIFRVYQCSIEGVSTCEIFRAQHCYF